MTFITEYGCISLYNLSGDKAMNNEDWITTAEAVRLSGYSSQYIRRLIRTGKIDARKFGPIWQVKKSALLTYLQQAERSDDKRRGPRRH
jgi:excisionase family DNA binding protein